MKRKLYFFQVNYPYGKAAHLPYTAGQLVAYAFDCKDISENYELADIFFLRERIDDAFSKVKEPFIVAFSTYIWNCNYNKTLAKLIKEKYPECIIVFGGHHVAPGGAMLAECPYIDYLLHGEGEIIFRRLMRALIGLEKAQEIPGISMRTDAGIITNAEIISEECNFPSPYLNGYFDKIIRENPETEFMGLIETSRGCPNSCAYCDWSNMKSKIRMFPIERIYGEIEWVMNNRIHVLGSADSNFGMFPRDIEITERLVEAKKKTGYPIRFQTSYAKNSSKRVFDIGMKLEESDMNRGVTLSFQSMSKEVLKNIGRANISIDYYSELMKLYGEAGVATYTELILGLPGETVESLVDGIDELLNLGQHNSIYIHNCEWLPCSIMGQKDYVDRYKIKTSHIPLNQPHREYSQEDDIPEWSSVVTSTYSMDTQAWKKMNLFSYVVQAFHHMGILQFFALYLYNEGICSYKKFYTDLLEYFLEDCQSVAGKTFRKITDYLDMVLSEKGTLSCTDERFGRVQWPFEEYAYLCIMYEAETFYEEITVFLKNFNIDAQVFSELMAFQKNIMKKPFENKVEFTTHYNFLEYFFGILSGTKPLLKKQEEVISFETKKFESWGDFARIIAWYGRKNGATTYLKDVYFEER
ncbi:MAG: radical SAM protein [Ruminococcaceae bacterium]|nr:radical SAM protein [Oscillospiraceae bacterium]MBQ9913035.1 radical SAM protein [Clostridia bacterium]